MGILKNKKKFIIIGVVLAIAIIAIIVVVYSRKDDTDYIKENEKVIFTKLNKHFEIFDGEDYYEILSMEAYYYDKFEDDNLATYHYFYRIKYKVYMDFCKETYERDSVFFGRDGRILKEINMDAPSKDLEKYEDDIKDYEIAVEKGAHKTYTKEEIEKYLEKYKVEEEE